MDAIERGIVSENDTTGFPKQMWVVDEHGRVFEAMSGGTQQGYYHGYPIRKSDPLHARVISIWKGGDDVTG